MLYTVVSLDVVYRAHSGFSETSNVTLEHKTSLKCQFFEIEIYTSSES